jgi:glycosyltransferase involved in cell wall biosynthesis
MYNIVHFSNGRGGGVQTIIDNFIKLSSNLEFSYRIIYTIRIEDVDSSFVFKQKIGQHDQIFEYSKFENTYFVFKRLSNLLKDENEIIIAHDWLELGMASRLGLKNRLFYFLHANTDYYYNLAIIHKRAIEFFICYSRVIETKLKVIAEIPSFQIKHILYPIADITFQKIISYPLRILYCVNDIDEPRKNFDLVKALIKKLNKENVIWTIIGKSEETFDLINELDTAKITYYQSLPNKQVIEIMKSQHLFLLPSYDEGLPVTLIESMKCGVIPLVSSWEGAASEIIQHGNNGFILNATIEDYSSVIKTLYNSFEDLPKLSNLVRSSAELFCNPITSVFDLETIFLLPRINKGATPKLVYASRLDKKYIPNFLVKFIRKNIYLRIFNQFHS